MRLHTLTALLLCLAASLFSACDSGGGSGSAADPTAGVTSTQLTAPEEASFGEGALQLTVEDRLTLTLVAILEDGSTRDATADGEWSSSDPAVIAIDGPGSLEAVGAGEVEISVTLGELSANMQVKVSPIAVESITLSETEELLLDIGGSVQITATAMLANGKEEDVTDRVEWTSSNLDVAEVDGGEVTLLASGGAEITATADGVSASVRVRSSCVYPESDTSDNTIQVGSVMPALRWNGAFMGGGDKVDFSLEDVYCGGAGFENTKSITFIFGAGWCPACHEFVPQFASMFGNPIESNGGLIVFVEVQDANYGDATNAYANEEITRLIGAKLGVRVGDAQTSPRQNFFLESPTISALPTQMVVRTSDMQIIASSAQSPGLLPFAELSADPDGDWSHLLPTPNCGPEDEEAGEPNNTADQASTISAGTISGGVCDGQPDFFEIDQEGAYDVLLEFAHSDADLDMAIWPAGADPDNDQPAGVSDSTNNAEMLSAEGPSLLVVYSYSPAFSAKYTLTVTPR